FVKPAFSLRKKRSVKTHALSLLGTTRLLSRSGGKYFHHIVLIRNNPHIIFFLTAKKLSFSASIESSPIP
ncbi:MAG: hypothetical protein WAW61_09060, partial [Methylococcaceae bacterium]